MGRRLQKEKTGFPADRFKSAKRIADLSSAMIAATAIVRRGNANADLRGLSLRLARSANHGNVPLRCMLRFDSRGGRFNSCRTFNGIEPGTGFTRLNPMRGFKRRNNFLPRRSLALLLTRRLQSLVRLARCDWRKRTRWN